MTDVLLFHTADGGEIEYTNGQATMSDGLSTAAYLSLFGGNERDSGSDADEPLEWWGNRGETDETRKYRSRTQSLLRSLPTTSANLQLLEEAANADLAWMIETGIADSVAAAARITAPKRIEFDVAIVIGDETFPFTFEETWTAS